MVKTKKETSKKIIKKMYVNDNQRRLSKLVTGKNFDFFIMAMIVANAVLLGLMTSPTMDFYFGNIMYLLDRLFMAIFVLEMGLKIFALKKKFFASGWNNFDLIVVLLSSMPFMNVLIVLRTFRIFRLLKYFAKCEKVEKLVQTFISLLPLFLAFLGVFLIFFYVFAIISVNLYGQDVAFFQDLPTAMGTLLKMGMFEGWKTVILLPMIVNYPDAWMFFGGASLLMFLFVVAFVLVAAQQFFKKNKEE